MSVMRALACGLWLACVSPLAAAAPADEAADVAVAEDGRGQEEALALLRAVSDAYRRETFRGRLVYVRGNRMSSMQVVHAVIDGVEHERLSHLDHSSAEVIRRGADIVHVHPDARMTRLGSTGAGSPFRQFGDLDAGIARLYQLVSAGQSRVAGRTVDLLKILPRDQHRYGYRLWVDRDSRLPLRYEVVNRKGAPLESVEFVELETDIEVPRELFEAPPAPPGRVLSVTASGDAEPPAVAPAWLPEGFRRTGSERQRLGAQPESSSAMTYSDGLAAFSFFVERAGPGVQPAARQIGPTIAVSGVLDAPGAGRYLVTLVGELPAGTAVRIVESARHQGSQDAAGREDADAADAPEGRAP